MSIFFSTAADAATAVSKKLVPSGSSVQFQIGDEETDDLSNADCLEIVEIMEDRLFGYLPDRYRVLLNKVDGEVLTEYSTEGQTALQASLYPITEGTLKLYVDYPRDRWIVRNEDVEATQNDYDFTVNNSTGAITITSTPSGSSLEEGQKVLAEYSHTAASTQFPFLKDIVVTWTVIELSRRFSFFKNENFPVDRFEEWEADRNRYLNEMRRQERGIEALDNINLVYEDQDKIRREFNYSKLLRVL